MPRDKHARSANGFRIMRKCERKRRPRCGAAMSHREIARRLGISAQRVQQIEARALEKLRAALVGNGADWLNR